ncbi:MAG: leucine-rich repeat domain-containing protein [Clostridiales bacterium]|nr:leucine-rich repeat domain-containing protein [Clostridiales bacterium]
MLTKKKTKVFVILMAFMLVFTLAPMSLGTAYADGDDYFYDDYQYGDWTYVLKKDGSACLYKYEGSDTELIIPAKIEGHPVTELYETFHRNESLIKVTIPESVTMTCRSFYGCPNLETVIIKGNKLKKLGNGTFSGCKKLKEVTLPESLTVIEEYAFSECVNLAEITFPEGLTTIGEDAFGGCESLDNITLPEGLTTIGQWAFGGCSSLKKIVIPASVTMIGKGAFGEAGTNAEEFQVEFAPGNELKTLEYGTFDDCNTLKKITLPESLTAIGEQAFYQCSNLEKIVIPAKVTMIGGSAFARAGINAEEFQVEFAPGSYIETIDDWAFSGCTTLKKIRIPANVKSLGAKMFLGDTALEELIIEPGSGVETIEEKFCENCSNLNQITIPNSVKKVCKNAFANIYYDTVSGEKAEIHYIGTMDECNKIDWVEGWGNPYRMHIFYESGPEIIESASLDYDGVIYYVCGNPDTKGWELFITIYKPEKFTLSKTSYTYTGKALKPKVTVTNSVGSVIGPENYKVTYANNTKVGKATATVTFKGSYYRGTKELNFTIKKAANTLKVKPLTAKVKYSALKKASMTLKRSAVLKVTGAKGKVTYSKVSGTKKITIAKTTGKVTVKKGLKKGTYKVKVKVKAAGTANYKSLTKSVTFKIKVI